MTLVTLVSEYLLCKRYATPVNMISNEAQGIFGRLVTGELGGEKVFQMLTRHS